EVSRIVAGSLRLEVRPVMVAPAVEGALAAMQTTAATKGVRLERELDETAGPVRGGSTRLQQIVWNLLSNAIQFTPNGGTVVVRLARRNAAVDISVRDTGEGIAAERLAHIFTRFVSQSSSQSQGGLGLGLAIVRHLVELHGGAVQAASAGSGQGATFTVTLPIAPVPYRDRRNVGDHRVDEAGRLRSP